MTWRRSKFVGLSARVEANQTLEGGNRVELWRRVDPSDPSRLPAQKRAGVKLEVHRRMPFFIFFVKRAFRRKVPENFKKNLVAFFFLISKREFDASEKHQGQNTVGETERWSFIDHHRSKPLKVVPKLWPWELSPCFTGGKWMIFNVPILRVSSHSICYCRCLHLHLGPVTFCKGHVVSFCCINMGPSYTCIYTQRIHGTIVYLHTWMIYFYGKCR